MSLQDHLDCAGLSRAAFAKKANVSVEAVRLWLSGERLPSPRRAIEIEAATDIPRHALRPDLWQPPAHITQDGTRIDRATGESLPRARDARVPREDAA